jgi:hypothetical protein
MTCMTLFAQPLAMATTQLVSMVQHEDTFSCHVEPKTEHKPVRMSWVVVTDESGKRQRRMHWVAVEDRSENRL